MQPGDPRADPAIVDLVELAGLWVAAADWPALGRTLQRLLDELGRRYPTETEFAARFAELQQLVESARAGGASAEAVRRCYRRAGVG